MDLLLKTSGQPGAGLAQRGDKNKHLESSVSTSLFSLFLNLAFLDSPESLTDPWDPISFIHYSIKVLDLTSTSKEYLHFKRRPGETAPTSER